MLQLVVEICEGPAPLDGVRRVGAWADGQGRICAIPCESAHGPLIQWPDVGWYLFDAAGRVRCWLAAGATPAKALATFERLRPLMLQRLGYEALHASAIAMGGGVIALCGRSGTGKSTLAYALARRGHRQIADDFLVLNVGEAVQAVPSPFEPRLRRPARTHFAWTEALRPSPLAVPAPLTAVLILRRYQGRDLLFSRQLEPAAAFRETLAHGHCYSWEDSDRRRRMIRQYLRIAETVPVYDTAFTAGLERLPELVSDLEELLTGAARQCGQTV